MPEGLVLRAGSNLHVVLVDGRAVECRARGRLRLGGRRVLTGDRVIVQLSDGGASGAQEAGVIEEILPRRTELARPPVANVDQVVVVASFRRPDLSASFIDRLLTVVSWMGLEPLICLNKCDLATAAEAAAAVDLYRRLGYRALATSARRGDALDELARELKGRSSVLAGVSGAGKSTLLNALQPGLGLRTGEVSDRVGRGRHTTRHAELVPLADGGTVVDTPGFLALDALDIRPEALAECFPEMRRYLGRCQYSDCRHRAEPECAVKGAVAAGDIPGSRYESYLRLLAEIETVPSWLR